MINSINRPWASVLLLSLIAAGPIPAESKAALTAPVVMNSQSVQMMPSTPVLVTGYGNVTSYFSTYNGPSGAFLLTSGGYVSGELRPRANTNFFEGGYAQATDVASIDYGSYALTFPSDDTDGNGLLDVIQFDRPGSFTATGSGLSVPSGNTFSIAVVFTRAANQAVGTYKATTVNSLSQTTVVSGAYLLSTYQGVATYSRGATNTLALSIAGSSPNAPTITGSTTYTVSSASQMDYAGFTGHSPDGVSYQINAGTLYRSGRIYRGTVTLVDGLPATPWADYTGYILEITDNNDGNGNGVPDMTDPDAIPFVPSAPVITGQPSSLQCSAGSTVALNVSATDADTFQWKKNGTAIIGATSPILLLQNFRSSDAVGYSVDVTNAAGTTTSATAGLTLSPSSELSRLVNVSVRTTTGTGDQVLIVGFVLGGPQTFGKKSMLIRGLGPLLAGYGVPSILLDPIIQLIPMGASAPIAENDNWGGDMTISSVATQLGAVPLTSKLSKDAALVKALGSGVYSVKVSGVGGTTGTALAEIYDGAPEASASTTPRLINISARAQMSNDNPLIAGFVIAGVSPMTVLIRATGPYLSRYFGPAAMRDPKVTLYQGGMDVATNDNWNGVPAIITTSANLGAFPLPETTSKDGVLLLTLNPGVYTAVVKSADGTAGIALLEIYAAP